MHRGKFWTVAVVCLALLSILIAGCSQPAAPTTSTPAKPAPTTSAPATSAPTTTAAPKPTATPTTSAPVKRLGLVVGSSSASSTDYFWGQVLSDTINKFSQGITATHVETGGTYDNLQRLATGDLQVGAVTSYGGMYEGYYGLPPTFKTPNKELRVLFTGKIAPDLTFVRADLPVNSIEDLRGKNLTLGAGSAKVLAKFKIALGALGIEAKYYSGSWTDTVTAFKERRIDGFEKAMPGMTTLDGSITEIMATLKVKYVGYTEEQKNKVLAKSYIDPWIYVKPGQYKEFPDAPGGWQFNPSYAVVVTTKMSADTAYDIMKSAFVTGKSYLLQNSPQFASINGDLQLSLDTFITAKSGWQSAPADQREGAFLHAGAVKFLKEQGIKLPANLIPPEYKE